MAQHGAPCLHVDVLDFRRAYAWRHNFNSALPGDKSCCLHLLCVGCWKGLELGKERVPTSLPDLYGQVPEGKAHDPEVVQLMFFNLCVTVTREERQEESKVTEEEGTERERERGRGESEVVG